jgi:hypothetical protein
LLLILGWESFIWIWSHLEVGKSDISRIYRLCNSYDKLQSKWSQPEINHRKRYRYTKARARIQRRIQNLVDKFHKKTTKLTCKNYCFIFTWDSEDDF